jgi:hypothetical protein
LQSFVDAWLEADLPTTAAGFVPIASEIIEIDTPTTVTSMIQ